MRLLMLFAAASLLVLGMTAAARTKPAVPGDQCMLSGCEGFGSLRVYVDGRELEYLSDTVPGVRVARVATGVGGYHLIAYLNGRRWIAETMNPLVTAGMVAAYDGQDHLALPVDKYDAREGNVVALGPNSPIELKMEGFPGDWITDNGEVRFVKVDDHWATGIFWVSLVSADDSRRLDISAGSFRVSLDRFSGRVFNRGK